MDDGGLGLLRKPGQDDLHVVGDVAGGLQRDRLARHAGRAVAGRPRGGGLRAGAVAKLEGVVDGAEEEPGEEADVRHAVEELAGALRRRVARRVEQPG